MLIIRNVQNVTVHIVLKYRIKNVIVNAVRRMNNDLDKRLRTFTTISIC